MSIWVFLELMSFLCITMTLNRLRCSGDREARIEAAWAAGVSWAAMVVVAIHYHRECERREPIQVQSHQATPVKIAEIPQQEWTVRTVSGNTITWRPDHVELSESLGRSGYPGWPSGSGSGELDVMGKHSSVQIPATHASDHGGNRL